MANWTTRWDSLNLTLTEHQRLWTPLPFKEQILDWEREFPELSVWLLQLSNSELHTLENNPDLLTENISRFIPQLALLRDWCEFVPSPTPSIQTQLLSPPSQIPGRKWQQIRHFIAALPTTKSSWIEWCSGKGHLARCLSQKANAPIHCLEWDKRLCEQGVVMAEKYELPITFECTDVMEDFLLSDHSHALALHACGELHRELLRKAQSSSLQTISYAPCCYDKLRDAYYTPISTHARKIISLKLQASQLRLAVNETVTAPKHVQRKRQQNSTWRLAFDLLQQTILNTNSYRSLPSFKQGELKLSFDVFCRTLAARLGISISPRLDLKVFLEKGKQRYHEVTRKDLLRHLFRRPLETWLVLDQALFLEESGYHTDIQVFCSRDISPRNLMVRANYTNI